MVFNRQDNQEDVHDKNGANAKAVRSFNTILKSDWTSFSVAYPDTVTEVYSFKDGLTVIQTITIVYTNASKTYISMVTRA
jgi:hypothetical protein